MRTKLIESNRPERYIHSVRNVDVGSVSSISTVFNSIPQGAPVCLALGPVPQPTVYANGLPPGAEDGLQVCLPVSAANNTLLGVGGVYTANFMHYGVAVGNIPYGQIGEVMVHGVYPFALFVRTTRSATTASWASAASISGGQFLSVDTLNNAFVTQTATVPSVSVFLLDSVAAFTGAASASTDTRTAMYTPQRVFIREM